LHRIRFAARSHAKNAPGRAFGIEFDSFQQASLAGVVLPDKEIQTAQFGKFEVAEELESGDVEGWNHG
jgi:hypothetical protein